MGAPEQMEWYPIMLSLLAAAQGTRVIIADNVSRIVRPSSNLYPFFLVFIREVRFV
jgi:hypothetical protein